MLIGGFLSNPWAHLSDREAFTMKRRIIGSLISLFLLVAIGGSVATWYVASTSEELGHIVELHEVQDLRNVLVIDAQAVQADLHTARTTLAHDPDAIFANLAKLEEASEGCLSCHHHPEVEGELSEIGHLVEEYKIALRNYLTASEDANRIRGLEIDAAGILEQLLRRSERMSQEAGASLGEISKRATMRINNVWLILDCKGRKPNASPFRRFFIETIQTRCKHIKKGNKTEQTEKPTNISRTVTSGTSKSFGLVSRVWHKISNSKSNAP